MVSLAAAIGLLVMLAVHTLVASIGTRFFRIRFESRWVPVVYTVVLLPIVLVASTLVLSGPIGLGGDLGSPALVVTLLVVMPIALGYTIDVFWMPHPDEVTVPDRLDG